MAMLLSIGAVNAFSAMEFAAVFGHLFEHAPWVAERAAGFRPFEDRQAMHRAMLSVVASADRGRQLALLAGHPELAGKAAIDRSLTADSAAEQGGAGLDRLTAEEFAEFHRLNSEYRTKFGFPFILAVRGLDKLAILEAFGRRLQSTEATEFDEALRQVGRISALRLADLVADA
ncbi:MAG: 2-oxo-4-hydroxy-4-carboxy-5-ureidoimidazoline decarboxylase [Alphaproteobacteria bacterium]|nr:2-oxo-4-hydroxy-4-carboxy-5-ureidoimidazoline decarboxylase [Alphaproteobacteria bacterium]